MKLGKLSSQNIWALLLAGTFAAMSAGAALAQDKVSLATPGVPPVWAGVMNFVAKDRGIYSKYGLDATVRPFNAVDQSLRAVLTGDVNVALVPTPVVINVMSNSGADLVALMGLENPDWLVGSMDGSKATCKDLAGQGVAVDAAAGTRGIVLSQVLRSCGLTMNDVNPVALASAAASGLVSGRINYGVLHIDDVPVIERMTGKKVHVVKTLKEVNPNTHYLLLVAKRSEVAAKRDMYARIVAAHIEAISYMREEGNAAKVAEIAAVTGRQGKDAVDALKAYNAMEFWPVRKAGLTREKIAQDIATQQAVGGIIKGKTPVTYEQMVDTRLFSEALQLVK
jgi:ABC-type nitrate/sulfonate/bicarbonate transport system substrate-binding protein